MRVALSTPKVPHWRSSSPGSLVPTHAGKPSSTSTVTCTHTYVTVNSGSLGPSVYYCCSSAVSNFPSLYPLLADMASPTLARDGLRSFLSEADMELLSLHPPKGTSGGPLQSGVQAYHPITHACTHRPQSWCWHLRAPIATCCMKGCLGGWVGGWGDE